MNSDTALEIIRINDLGADGKAVGRDQNGKVIFLEGGLPGELVEAQIFQRRRKFDRGKVIRAIEPSEFRISAPCGHFDLCGGCAWQDLEYQTQLEFKKKRVIDNLERLGGFENVVVDDILPCVEHFRYRNKMEFSFGAESAGHESENKSEFALGLHLRGEFARIFNVAECLLMSETCNEILNWFREFVRTHKIPAYDVRNHHGYLRFLMLREGKKTGEIMINIVTSSAEFPNSEELVSELTQKFPTVATIVHNKTDSKANIAYGESQAILYGPGYIREQMLGKSFRIYANSFFQTNTLQAENLYNIAIVQAELRSSDRLMDLYCGAGSIGICLAESVQEIIGIEMEESAIVSARENAIDNKIENISFIAGDVRKTLRERKKEFRDTDIVIVDPPRAGMIPRAVHHTCDLGARRIVYVSCNPGAFARDAVLFNQGGYTLKQVSPVDMFPHTTHIELVAILDRR